MPTYEDGIREVCEEIHKYCLKQGMEEYESNLPYIKIISFITNKFGKYRGNSNA